MTGGDIRPEIETSGCRNMNKTFGSNLSEVKECPCMQSLNSIVPLLKAKGWNLYKGIPRVDLPAIIAQGRTTSIERGAFYHVLPVAFRDSSFEEVTDHLAYAHETKQMPVYNDCINPPSIVRGLAATDGGIAIVPAELAGAEEALQGYEFDAAEVETAITRSLSNYNIHYFDSIDDIATFVVRNGITPQRPSLLPGQLRWSFASRDESPEKVVIYPEDASPFLFRGQGKRYEPCNPAIARELKTAPRDLAGLTRLEQAILILNLIRTQWFVECLRETPLFEWTREKKVHMEETAVAQHYGLPTGYIDLSQSFDVASFFACCRYDRSRGSWSPIASGEGVMYVVDQRMVPLEHGPKPIGLQPFPRPSEQWGWVHEVRLGDDFDNLPYVKKFIFRHNEDAAQRILERFHFGADLFPPDPMAVVADRIMNAREIPLSVAKKTVHDLVEDPQGLLGSTTTDILTMITTERNVRVVDSDVAIIDDELRSEIAAGWEQRKAAFLEGVGFRLTRSAKPDSD